MSENVNTAMNTMAAQPAGCAEQNADPNGEKKKLSTEEHLARIAKGKLRLLKPIRGNGRDIEELRWDFRNLNGWEYASAMDCDVSASVMNITTKQALSLFAVSAAKETTVKNESEEDIHPLNEFDIRTRIGVDDAVKAAQLASLFFLTSARVADKRISHE